MTSTCKACTQSTESRCTRQALQNVIHKTGIKAAYCNDEFLVIYSDGSPGFTSNLYDIPNPPGEEGDIISICRSVFSILYYKRLSIIS